MLILQILGTPNAKKDAIGKIKGNRLKISVKATPDNGKATDYMVDFLAKEFKVSKKNIEVVYGRFQVNKLIKIKSPQQIPKSLVNLIKIG